MSESRNKVAVDIEDKDIKRFTSEIDKSIDKVSYGIIAAGLIIASTILIALKIGPFIYGFPFLSVVFLIIALILGAYIFVYKGKKEER